MEDQQWQQLSLRGILALMIVEREERAGRADARKTEVLLADAGFPPVEIARLTGKTYAAVAKAVQRARRKTAASVPGEASDGDA